MFISVPLLSAERVVFVAALLAGAALAVLARPVGDTPTEPVAAPPEAAVERTEPLASLEPVRPSAVATPPATSPRTRSAPARIQVPRLGIDLPLVDGDAVRDTPAASGAGGTPEHAAFLYPGTGPPGAGRNTFVYAHARPGMFLALWGAHLGDEVVVAFDSGERYLYVVTRVEPRVVPEDTSWLDAAGPERLTLQTSTGPDATYPRFIVVASAAR